MRIFLKLTRSELRLFLLDQDGPAPDDADRARKRGVSVGRQGRDAMVSVHGQLTPQAWATGTAPQGVVQDVLARVAGPTTARRL